MSKIIFLGACSELTKNQDTVSFILSDQQTNVLVDAGPTVVKQLLNTDYKASGIDAIIITHQHGDHALGLPYLLFKRMGEFQSNPSIKPKDIDIYATEAVQKGLVDALVFFYPPGKFRNYNINWHVISDRDATEFKIGTIDAISYPVEHAVDNVGLCFKISNGKKIVYSSDTIYSENVVSYAKNCDLLIHEAFGDESISEIAGFAKHATAKEAGLAAQESNAKKLVLVHYMPPFAMDHSKLIDDARKMYSGSNIVVAKNFTEIVV